MRISEIPKELKEFVGRNIKEHLPQPQSSAFDANWKQMEANYGENVDGQLLEHQVLMCEQTMEFLYSSQWQCTNYVWGSRPELERIVKDVVGEELSERQKVLAIMCFCRDLYKKNGGLLLFYGGTEEELIKKGNSFVSALQG